MNPEARNPHLGELDQDFLYHLGLDTSMNLEGMFGDVKYVCMGGSAVRAEDFGQKLCQELGVKAFEGGGFGEKVRRLLRSVLKFVGIKFPLKSIGKTERFSMYKAGSVISVSHGMGMPSMLILLDELAKLLDYAGAENVKFIRIGTSGGVGVEPGTVIVAEQGLNGKLESYFEQIELGKLHRYPTTLDSELAEGILEARGDIDARLGITMGTNNFYAGQGRLDGALKPNYNEADKMAFLKRAREAGVRNIEMEATAFAAFCLRAGISGAVVCTALLNRLEGDQVTSSPQELAGFSDNAQRLVLQYIRGQLERVAE